MAKRVSKNQRTNRRSAHEAMAKVIVSEKKPNGQFRYRNRVVMQSRVQEILKEAKG